MLELEFLGVQPDGNHMTLNDSDGNRYSLPITDELRAALRRDRVVAPIEEPKPMSPKDIQAHFRAGRSLEELSEMTSMPASQLSPFEYPILAEREYTANQARSYRIGHEIGSLTVEELVTSRLTSRDVNPRDIEWTAVREPNKPWALSATYTVAGRETVAEWSINQDTHSLTALNDEARWLSETEIPVKDSPWRPLAAATPTRIDDAPVTSDDVDEAPVTDSSDTAIVSMLDSLSIRRGTHQPMALPDDEDYPPAAHPPASRPEEATDATVLSLPPRPSRAERAKQGSAVSTTSASTPASSTTSTSAPSAPETASSPSAASPDKAKDEKDSALFTEPEKKAEKPAKRRRGSNRPAMPSWDEIVFGHSKD